jgi:polysaccharide export outer membrane protein
MLLLATLLAAPLAFGAVQEWAWGAMAVGAFLMLLLWSIAGARQGHLKILWSPLYVPTLLFLLLGTIQFSAHRTLDPIATRESLLKLSTALIFFFLAGQLLAIRAQKMLRDCGFTVVVYSFSLALLAMLQFFSSHGLIYWSVRTPGSPFGPYVNHNHYAGLMEMLIPVGAGYVLSRPRDDPLRTSLGFALLVPVASLLLCGSRGGFISLFAEVVILGAILLWPAPAPGRRSLAAAGGLGITAAVLLFLWMDPGEVSRHLLTIAHTAQSPEATFGDREVATLDCLHILRDRPWMGVGLGGFETAFPAYQSFPTDFVWGHAHNDFAEALAETGLVGGVLMVAALAMFFHLAFKRLGERLRCDAGWIRLGAALGCCGLLVHSFVDFNLRIPANAAWFAVLASVATIAPMGGGQSSDVKGVKIMAEAAKGWPWRISSRDEADGRALGRLVYGASHPARGAMLLAGASLICLCGHAWAQNPVTPTTVAPISSLGPAASSASPSNRVGARYVIARDDLLEVYVVGLQELSRQYRVDGDGMITVPMLPQPVMAAGLTLDQLSEALRKNLLDAGVLTDPQITVTVKSSPWNSVVLSGAAKKPGVYPVYGHTTLLELLTQSEGLSDDAGSTAIVTRAENAQGGPGPNTAGATQDAGPASSRTVDVDVWRLWQNGDASQNVDLYPGDRVMVQRAGIIYVVGAVNRSGGFVLSNNQEQMTVLKAIALAGNFTRAAKPGKAVIIRKISNAPGGRQEVPVDLKKVLSNRAPDQQLLANDIIYVPESGVKRTLDEILNAAVYTTVWRAPY